MSSIKGRPQGNLVPVNADNANTRDWLVLLEASTIVGHERGKLRVALVTQERKFVKNVGCFAKRNISSSSTDSSSNTRAVFLSPTLQE